METSLLGFAGNLYYQHRSSTVLTITAEKCTGRKSPAKFSGKHIPMIRGVVAFKRAATSLRISAGLARFMAKNKQLEQFLLARILKIQKTGFSGAKCTGFLFPGLVSRTKMLWINRRAAASLSDPFGPFQTPAICQRCWWRYFCHPWWMHIRWPVFFCLPPRFFVGYAAFRTLSRRLFDPAGFRS